jgi:folate-dependent phosphoribosylglycinamide formyltransferase PurN
MRVGIFFSGGASAYKAVRGDHNNGHGYEIVFGLTNNPGASGIKLLEGDGIPVIVDPVRFPSHDLRAAEPEYERVRDEIAGYKADLLMLSGWMRFLRYPIIERGREGGEIIDRGQYTNRVLNVHPALLSILSKQLKKGRKRADCSLESTRNVESFIKQGWNRAYTGDNAVYDAVVAGEEEVGSTIHLVDAGCDSGSILIESNTVDVLPEVKTWIEMGRDDLVRDYCKDLQNFMKWHCDGPAYIRARGIRSSGSIALEGSTVFALGEKLPYGGIQME